MPSITLEDLQARLEELDKERDLILGYIALKNGEHLEVKKTESKTISSGSTTIRGRVVDAVIELIDKLGRQVNSKEILAYIEEKGLSLGSNKNKANALGAILGQESEKVSARLKRISTGVYDKK